ncbi:MAG: alpha-L-fucosidase [Bacteroidales bacterium]
MRNRLIVSLLCVLMLSPVMVFAQKQEVEKRTNIALEHGAHRLGKRTDDKMQAWRDYGLGQFIHWGVYAIAGGHWNGECYTGAAEWIRSWNKMPKDAYDNLYKQFNPSDFDAKAWAKQAKDMGAKYMIITTKHHDGFCLWPSKYTDYTIANTPYKKDIIGELVKAYDEQGIDVYLYFSIIDWNHHGYKSSIKTEKDRKEYEEFKTFTRNQLVELLERYPTTKGLWFDGTWDAAWKEQAEFADDLDKELRAMIPGLIIGSRFRPDDYGSRHFDTNGNLIGDYEQGWERKIPQTIEDINGNDWDCVMTIPENQWGYHSNWFGHVKTSNELIEMLVRSVSLDGNFVLNFGPDGKGDIREEEDTLAKEIGDWMSVNKEVIYGCGYLNWKKQDWGYYTVNRKTGKKYMVVFNKPMSGALRVKTLGSQSVDAAFLISEPQSSLKIEKIYKDEYIIYLSGAEPSDKPFVIVIDEKGDSKEDDNSLHQKAKT